jgi:class 3 adenylate cyclase/tetratricopeptide (TPR) repeat protein
VAICASCGQETPDGFPRCANCGASLDALPPALEQRKTVTVVFCDITGSTELGESTDPEALRALLSRYFDRMKGIVESHGGSVEKFIGDAVMAVFGVPVAHEDDALRACRAAVEMRDALPELGIVGRIGVNTGEVVTGTEERLATGDAVNVAARLEQAAEPGEVLIGEETSRLVRAAVGVGEERRLDLKGKAELVPAYPLLEVKGELGRSFSTPMVGRERELQGLRDAFARADADRSCQLFTVLGSAGVGKSRLATEFLADLEARVVRGRCLSYGEGITYWPVVEIVKQLATLPAGDAERPLRSLLGETELPASAEEIAWGFRKLLEQEAQAHPLIVVFDDLHWAEETLFDLIEHVADLSRDAPLLLLCMARPELLERRPSWGGGKWNATAVLLEPLDAAETEQLLSELGDVAPELRERIVEVAEGNPLFVEEMLALVRESGGAEVEVPPTIQALLAARLDQLDPAERSVLERGSIEGRTFHRGAVAALAEDDGDVERRLVALVRKELVRPERAQLAADDAYRFRHLLIRDAAYGALPKATRAELHRRFAAWLEEHGQSLVELDEILGYHLEQAARYLTELGRPEPEVAAAAAKHLAASGRRARGRNDRDAARALLERAVALNEDPDAHLLVDLARSHKDPRVVAALMDDAGDRAEASGDEAGAALARTLAADQRVWAGESSSSAAHERLALAALPLLEANGDHAGLALVWLSLAQGPYNARAQFSQMAEASEQALRDAKLAGQPQLYLAGDFFAYGLTSGPCTVGEALRRLDAPGGDPNAGVRILRAFLLAMNDQDEEALSVAYAAEARLRELGYGGTADMQIAQIDLLAGRYEAADRRLARAADSAVEQGVTAALSSVAADRARVLCGLGRFEEAEPLAEQGRQLSAEDDAMTQVYWRQAAALVSANRGDHADAERLAGEAVEIARQTDSPLFQGDALYDLGEVLDAAGRREEAATSLRGALAVYERKGVIPLARRTRERLTAMAGDTVP